MSSPLPHGPDQVTAPATPGDSARSRDKLARKWAYLISSSSYVPLSRDDIVSTLLDLVTGLAAAVRTEPADPTAVAKIGARLVELNCVDENSLRLTLDLLGKGLLNQPDLRALDHVAERVVSVLSSFTSGYVEALRLSIFDQQENINQALIKVTRDAQRSLSASEARFDEVFARVTSGMAITDLTGAFVRTNRALREILDRRQSEFTKITLFELIPDDEQYSLRQSLDALVRGRTERVEERRTMLRSDGETVRPVLMLSLLRSLDGQPSHYMIVVADDTELSLLQRRLEYQSLHDVLTGLPNLQYLTSRLEKVLHQVDPVSGVTFYQLNLDAFSVITDGLGWDVGDRLLESVADRLQSIFAEERAMVARIDGDEFAVLVENSPTTPDVATTVRRINTELDEPIYVEDIGVAASAGIGVVRIHESGADPAEVLRTANLTLHTAKRHGHRQWELFDLGRDASDLESLRLAAAMPGALETGELRVVYERQVSLRTGRTVGVEAALCWDHPEFGELGHRRCVELADSTGLILPMGNWLLRSACEQLQRSSTDLPVSVSFTSSQARDVDLPGNVLRIIEDTGIHPGRLRLGLPADTLTCGDGRASENLTVLVDNGVEVFIDDFGVGGDDLACLEDVLVGGVRIAQRLVERQAGVTHPDTMMEKGLRSLVSIVRSAGVAVTVCGIANRHQARWWRRIGCDIALGRFFGPASPLDEVIDDGQASIRIPSQERKSP